MPNALSVTGLRKAYGSVQALRGVDLELGNGELFGLLGPNGAGKSTLVKIACGLVRPSAGRVAGLRQPRRVARRARAARLPGGAVPLPRLVHRGRAARPAPGADRLARRRGRAARAARARRAGPRSRSPRRRDVEGDAAAPRPRAGAVGSPRLLLLDEPTSALDPAGRHAVRALLERLRERGVSVLLNSHLLSEVELVCDRVAIINGGEVVAAGTPAQLSRPGGVEVETAAGVRSFAAATREDAPRIVRELVAAGEDVFAVHVLSSTLEDAYLEAVGRAPAPPRTRPAALGRPRDERRPDRRAHAARRS